MIYCLYHRNIISEDGIPDDVDDKIIGHYTSIERALDAREKCKSIPGFADFPDGFGIELVLQKDSGGISEANQIYRNAYIDDYIDGVDTCFEGYYVSKEAAESALQGMKRLPRFVHAVENLGTYEVIVDRDEWPEGFVTESTDE